MVSTTKVVGSVRIPLETIDQHADVQDSEYTLRANGISSEQTGTVRLKLTWSSSLDEEAGLGGAMSAAEEIVEDETEDEPNELHVSVLRAKDLLVMDRAMIGKGSSDPRAVITVGKETKKSETIEKNLNPVWLEKFVFETDNHEDSIVLKIEDVDFGGVKTDFMGKIVVPLIQLQNKR
jgi:Ca2+-dependent lipid-binding protein